MNISVPDELAEEVRRRELAISAICQRALREEIAKLRAIEGANDILVYVESEQTDPDPLTWPRFDVSKPTLTYKSYPVGRRWELGWVLEYEAGGEPGNPTDYFIPGDPDKPPIERAREVLREASHDMEQITVDVGEPSLTVGFTGRWLLEPDAHLTRTSEAGYEAATSWDADAYWGIALTGRGRIAVYSGRCTDGWPARLDDYDTLDQAADHVPADIIARAAAELGEERVIWRDI